LKLMRSILSWGPVIAWMALLSVLSLRSSVPGAEFVWDKLAHAMAYGVLAWLCLRATHGGFGPLRPWPVIAALVIALAHGALAELAQHAVAARQASFGDWVADTTGALAALPAVQLAVRRRRRRGALRAPEVKA
jgi:VanZ family protein